jgi:malonyl-CoA O-methyltransferase
MKIQEEFSRNAKYYDSYNIVQVEVAKKLLTFLNEQPKKVLDLGCGSGTLFKNIDFDLEKFIAVDFSQEMLNLHPDHKCVKKICADFNEELFFENIKNEDFEVILSASAIQWAKDLDQLFKHLKAVDKNMFLAIFTSNTFKSIYEIASLKPILRSSEEILNSAQKYFDCKVELQSYKLNFENTKEMFRYIKKSGVSGGKKVLDYKSTKELMSNYPHNYLEFEVLFIMTLAK